MYLFTRQILLNPAHLRDGMAHALDMLNFVNKKTELGVSLFQVLQGAPLGTLTYAYRTDSYAASVEATDALLRSDKYLEKVEKGAKYTIGNAEDRLATYIHVAGEIAGAPAAVGLVTARMEVHRVKKAIAWSAKLADFMHGASGVPCALVTSNVGPYGAISWINYGDSLAQLESATAKVNTDPGFLQHLEESNGLFVPGSGMGVLSRKIG